MKKVVLVDHILEERLRGLHMSLKPKDNMI